MTLALLPGGFQLAVAFRVDFLLTPRQHILRRDVADGTVQADVVVMLDVSLHQAQRIVQRERCSGPDTLALQRLVPTLDFPIRLGIVGGSSDMRHARDANELYEVERLSVLGGKDVFVFELCAIGKFRAQFTEPPPVSTPPIILSSIVQPIDESCRDLFPVRDVVDVGTELRSVGKADGFSV